MRFGQRYAEGEKHTCTSGADNDGRTTVEKRPGQHLGKDSDRRQWQEETQFLQTSSQPPFGIIRKGIEQGF